MNTEEKCEIAILAWLVAGWFAVACVHDRIVAEHELAFTQLAVNRDNMAMAARKAEAGNAAWRAFAAELREIIAENKLRKEESI